MAPITVTIVPNNLAWHLTFLKSSFSILQRTAMMNVIEGSMLHMAHEYVGDVIFSPT